MNQVEIPINRRLASLAEEVHEIFAALLPGEDRRDALRALQQRTGASDALMRAARKISIARLGENNRGISDGRAGSGAVDIRASEVGIRDDPSGARAAPPAAGDDDVTLGEVITQDEFERLAVIFSLTFSADGEVCDGLQ
jgi:hypothetical protein